METEQTPQAAPPRPLLRSRTDRHVAGVCGGLGAYTGVDPLVFRIVVAVSVIFGGAGLVAYIVAWLLIPEEGEPGGAPVRSRGRNDLLTAVVIGAVAVVLVGWAIPGHPWSGEGGFLLLVGLGALAWLWSREQGTTGSSTESTPAAGAGPWLSPGSEAAAPPPTSPEDHGVEGAPPSPPTPRSRLSLLVGSSLLLLWGAAATLEAARAARVDLQVVLGLSVVIVGIGLIAGTWFGRPRGLIALGVTLLALTVVIAVVDIPLRGGVGERRWSPAAASEVEGSYRLFVGDAVLDLSDVSFRDDREIEVRMGLGALTVIVPDEVDVEMRARVSLGELDAFGHQDQGAGNRRRATIEGDADGPTLRLVARLGVGTLEVRRAAS
ncbi:MAG TPA: PspC domain-containing protein [Acidimicrobiales bacterium]|nr:PspC domain-containing protein [Acidimicrobiales bacterium]